MQVPVQNQPAQQPQPVANRPAQSQQQYTPLEQNAVVKKSSKAPWIVLVVVVILVLGALGFLFRGKFTSQSSQGLSGYQAVFLTNGQVYFGKLGRGNSGYATLTDIFYLQVNQPLQSGTETAAQQAAAAAAAQANPQLSLVKLGNELHGPQDLMYINRDQILFYENMEASGKVAQAIAAYKASNGSSAATGTQAPASSSSQLQNPATTGQGAGANATAPAGVAPAGVAPAAGQ